MDSLTDLEVTIACAEAMGLVGYVPCATGPFASKSMLTARDGEQSVLYYDPLNHDAQAMALVKRFRLSIGFNGGWGCVKNDKDGMLLSGSYHFDSLNEAICGCVARMDKSARSKP